jgi:hypothetical protein
MPIANATKTSSTTAASGVAYVLNPVVRVLAAAIGEAETDAGTSAAFPPNPEEVPPGGGPAFKAPVESGAGAPVDEGCHVALGVSGVDAVGAVIGAPVPFEGAPK